MNYTIAPADPTCDRDALQELWARNFPEASPDRHRWLYADGPAVGWLARTPEGRAVGATGVMHRKMKLFNETAPAGQAIDLNVDRDHRSVAPALALQRAAVATVGQNGRRLLYALPNNQSEPVLRRMGYHVFGQLQRWAKPLRSEPFLRGRLRSPLVRKPVAKAIDSLLMLQSREMRSFRPRGLHFRKTDRFDARFNDLWHAAAPQFPVIGERTAAYLDWRWHWNPGMDHHVLTLCDEDNRILAYAVYSRHEGSVYLDDFLFLSIEHLRVLLAELLRQARRERADAVITVYLGSPDVESLLEQFGFWKRPGSWNALVYVDPSHHIRGEQRLYDPASWHLTRADLDTDFQQAQ
jgi:hypothetical protein